MPLTTSSKALPKVGGGTSEVEVIKIAEWTTGANEHFSGGGGTFIDNKTLGQLLNGKHIVDIRGVADFTTTNNRCGVWVDLYVQDSSQTRLDVVISQNEESVQNAVAAGCNFIVPTGITGNVTLSIYAICI